jgi:hypothetical protein
VVPSLDLGKAGVLLAEAAAGPWPGPNGAYIDRGKVMRSSAASYDRAREDELWDTAGRLCGLDTAGQEDGETASGRAG